VARVKSLGGFALRRAAGALPRAIGCVVWLDHPTFYALDTSSSGRYVAGVVRAAGRRGAVVRAAGPPGGWGPQARGELSESPGRPRRD